MPLKARRTQRIFASMRRLFWMAVPICFHFHSRQEVGNYWPVLGASEESLESNP